MPARASWQNLAIIQIYKLRHPSSSQSTHGPTSIHPIPFPKVTPENRETRFARMKGNENGTTCGLTSAPPVIVVFRTLWVRMNRGIFLLQNSRSFIPASVSILIEPRVPVPTEHGPLRDEFPLQQGVIFQLLAVHPIVSLGGKHLGRYSFSMLIPWRICFRSRRKVYDPLHPQNADENTILAWITHRENTLIAHGQIFRVQIASEKTSLDKCVYWHHRVAKHQPKLPNH